MSTEDSASTTWREQAVARSLDSARTRAEKRVQRFLDAALELMNQSDDREFTVQEVVERSGQSLRSFYQYFGGKHELLLALFEESIRSTAELLREKIDDESEPGERLHRFIVEYYLICRPPSGKPTSRKVPAPTPVLVDFAQQLLTAYPTEAAGAFMPLVALFEEVLDEAVKAKVIRSGLNHRRVAGLVLESVMFNTFSATIAGTTVRAPAVEAADELWDLFFRGLEV